MVLAAHSTKVWRTKVVHCHRQCTQDFCPLRIDTPTRGYVTIIGKAVLIDGLEDKRAAWVEPFSAFWPDGPESEDYLLIVVTPKRIEARSYTQGLADVATQWTPVTLERTDASGWQQVS